MATYFGTSINESPTIVLPAKEKIEGVQGIALAISGGQLTKPTAGANVIGLSLFTNDETVEAGDDITVQVKDIGKWIAGEAIEVGDELTTNADGKAVKQQRVISSQRLHFQKQQPPEMLSRFRLSKLDISQRLNNQEVRKNERKRCK